jgi:nitroreductase
MATALIDLIMARRTVRKFTEADVTDEQVRVLLEAAVAAPTRFDIQPWHFSRLRDKPLQRQLAEVLRVHPYLETAPVVITVWGEPDRSPTWLMDCSAAIENLLLAAHAMGLGGAWVGGPKALGFAEVESLLRRELAAPLEVALVSLVALGVPASVPSPHGRERWNRLHMHLGAWGNFWE